MRNQGTGLGQTSISSERRADTFLNEQIEHTDNLSEAFRAKAYHELRENPLYEMDGLQRLNENLALLEDGHGRLHFMMREISVLLRSR